MLGRRGSRSEITYKREKPMICKTLKENSAAIIKSESVLTIKPN